MDITTALKTSIEYETRVRDLYAAAVSVAGDGKGKAIFQLLADEEQGHLDYLNGLLKEWEATGRLSAADLATAIPPRARIEQEIGKLEAGMATLDRDNELQMLSKALDLEIETSRFYAGVVHEVPEEGRPLFRRFIEIEDGHVAIVKAEVDYLIRTGCWFDFMEMDMDGA